MPDLTTLIARLDRLEQENTALRHRVRTLEEADTAQGGAQEPSGAAVSRRQLLRRASAGAGFLVVAGLAATTATIAQARPTTAQGGLGSFESSTGTPACQGLNTAGGPGVAGASQNGGYGVTGDSAYIGVYGLSHTGTAGVAGSIDIDGDGAGVRGTAAGTGPAVLGLKDASNGHAVHGRVNRTASPSAAVLGQTNGSGPGVQGTASGSGPAVLGLKRVSNGPAVHGRIARSASHSAAVYGQTDGAGPGVLGESAEGRGGQFRGPTAQIKLVPSTATTHPASGQRGDLFVDKGGGLWFRKGGTTWRQLA